MEPIDVLQVIRPLDQDGRTKAYKAAQTALATWIGVAPRREDFADAHASDWPRWVVMVIAGFMLVVFFAAAAPSLFRLFTAGRNYFMHGIADGLQGAIAGIATFLLAECMVIAATFAMRVLFKDDPMRWLMLVPIAFAIALALVGNWVVAQPQDAFGWLETVAPPIGVLSMSFLGEKLILKSIAARQQAENAFQAAYAEYQASVANLEQHERWPQFYANALIDQLRKVNKTKAAKDAFLQLDIQQKYMLYMRELRSDAWYVRAMEVQVAEQEQQAQRQQYEQERLARLQAKALQSGGGGGQHTGEVDNARIEQSGAMHVAHCPHCSYVTPAKETELQAKRALAAHLRSHKSNAFAMSVASEVVGS
jgi:hypothetical protein